MGCMSNSSESKPIQCGELTILPKLGRVEAADKSIRLGPVNMRVLVLLVENQGQVVARNKIFDSVWINQVVSDDTLTRCISDLRTQLGKLVGETKLIETIPKQGYQWISTIDKPLQKTTVQKGKKKGFIQFTFLLVIGLMVLSTTFLWVANHLIGSDKIKIALMPLQTTSVNQELSIDVGELLRENILKNKKIGYLSTSVLKNVSGNNFSYLSKEYGAEWIIEWKIRSMDDSEIINLSLVDARTALVVHSVNAGINRNTVKIKAICDNFIKDVERYLGL